MFERIFYIHKFIENGDENGDEGEFKDDAPKEFYIPPEPSTDESEIFGSGITSGINFSKFDKIPMNVCDISVMTIVLSLFY